VNKIKIEEKPFNIEKIINFRILHFITLKSMIRKQENSLSLNKEYISFSRNYDTDQYYLKSAISIKYKMRKFFQ